MYASQVVNLPDAVKSESRACESWTSRGLVRACVRNSSCHIYRHLLESYHLTGVNRRKYEPIEWIRIVMKMKKEMQKTTTKMTMMKTILKNR